MRRIFLVAEREFVEGFRQRWLVANLMLVLGVIAAGALGCLSLTDWLGASEGNQRALAYWTDVLGFGADLQAATLAKGAVFMLQALVFNQLMSMTAVMAGHAGIHDRVTGTLPFLLLAPVRRFELLAGKVIGSLSVPMLVYVIVGGLASHLATTHPSAAESAAYLPPSAGWGVTFFIAAPIWSTFTATICVLVSAAARDVRTAQQAAWGVVFFATFVLSPLLVGLLPMGAWPQLALAGVGLLAELGLLALGAWRFGRELSR